jgi:hypothetical protein
MDESSLGVHKIELMIDSGEDFSDGSGVRDHADSSHDLGEVTSWDNSWWLIVDTTFETSWAPVNELNGSLGLDGGNGSVDVLGDNITSVHHAAGHVFTVSWVTLGHHGSWLESGVGDLSDGELLVVSFLGRDDWGVRGKHEMDSWVWDQVSLELSDIDVKGTIESEGGGKRGDNLGDESVKVGVGWSLNIEGSSADIVDSFVVKHNGDIGMLKKRMGGEDGVVWLNNSGGDLWGWVDGETKLGFFTVIDRESLEEERTESGSGTTTDGVEDEETLKTGTLVSKLSDSVETEIDDFFTDGVMTSSEVVGSIFFTRDKLLWMEELSVGTSSDLINDGWLEIEEDASWDVLSSTSLGEEGVEGIITTTDSFIGWHLTIRLDSVLEAEELPTGVTNLDTGLTDVD